MRTPDVRDPVKALSRNEGLLIQNCGKKHPELKDQLLAMVVYLALALITQSVFKTITVWPSAGLVVAAFLVFGLGIWPGIALGTFLGVVAYFLEIGEMPFSFGHLVVNLVTVLGNTAAAMVALRVCGRVESLGASFAKFQWLVCQFIPAVVLFGLVSPIFSVGAFWLIGQPLGISYLHSVLSWVISDLVGAITIAPLLISLWLEGISPQPLRDLKTPFLAILFLLTLSFAIFCPGLSPVIQRPVFLLIPLVFVALTCSQAFTFFMLALTFFAVWVGTTTAYGPFVASNEALAHASMQAFIGVSATVILIMVTLLFEQRMIQQQWAEDLLARAETEKKKAVELQSLNVALEHEIDERKRAEAELKQYQEHLEELVKERTAEIQQKNVELAELNTTQNKFFSIIAHDLRGPIGGFLGLTEFMAEHVSDLTIQELQEFTSSMQACANKLYKLLINLLEWARIQRGTIEFNPESCNLSFLVKQNLDLQLELARQKDIELVNRMPTYLTVRADIPMLNTIIRNLISNAIKFTPRGGRIEIGCAMSEVLKASEVCIYVKDNGIGMKQDTLSKLFRIDQKVSRPGTDDERGTGLAQLPQLEATKPCPC